MADSLAAIVLAAGRGSRLRPLTLERPKALCPVAGEALVDLALRRVAAVVGSGPAAVAVNAHDRAAVVAAHVGDRATLSVEGPEALGTAGAVGALRPWLDGRDALVVNADAWHAAALAPLVADWDGSCVRVLVAGAGRGATLSPRARVLGSLLPAAVAAGLDAEPTGLYEVCWHPAELAGRLEVVGAGVDVIDCGTPGDYLAANLAASGGASVVGDGAVVAGTARRCVLWPGAVVAPGEVLVDAVRTAERTVLVRSPAGGGRAVSAGGARP
jgi:CTP:molybdopterin cytidylyltransferase MocA